MPTIAASTTKPACAFQYIDMANFKTPFEAPIRKRAQVLGVKGAKSKKIFGRKFLSLQPERHPNGPEIHSSDHVGIPPIRKVAFRANRSSFVKTPEPRRRRLSIRIGERKKLDEFPNEFTSPRVLECDHIKCDNFSSSTIKL
jgi:hypothetical protein